MIYLRACCISSASCVDYYYCQVLLLMIFPRIFQSYVGISLFFYRTTVYSISIILHSSSLYKISKHLAGRRHHKTLIKIKNKHSTSMQDLCVVQGAAQPHLGREKWLTPSHDRLNKGPYTLKGIEMGRHCPGSQAIWSTPLKFTRYLVSDLRSKE